MLLDIWSQPTGFDLGTNPERTDLIIPLPIKSGTWDAVTFTVISGALPAGLRLNGSNIIGYAFEVARNVKSEFVIRASNGVDFADMTLYMTIEGPTPPIWLTNPGRLPVNPNHLYYVLDNTPVSFQLEATDLDIGNSSLQYWVKSGSGELPAGLSLSSTGLIHGITESILSLEHVTVYGFDSTNWDEVPFDYGSGYVTSFDDYGYDNTVYDYQSTAVVPKKLNRNYQFTVSVSDGIDVIDRTFIILVVNDDFLRSDNTFMQVGTGVFTADNTYLRAPYWLTDYNLGTKRANNYTMYVIETLDPHPSIGPVVYQLEPFNPDDSASSLPDGMDIDEINCVLFGYSPYQPPVTINHTFTLSATKYDTDKIDIVEVAIVTYGVARRGQTSIKIYPLVTADVNLLVGQSISINDVFYTVTEYTYTPGSPYGIMIISAGLLSELPDKFKIYRNFYIPTDTGTVVSMSTSANVAAGATIIPINSVSTDDLDLIVGRNLKINNAYYKLQGYTSGSSMELHITPGLSTPLPVNYTLSITFRTDTVVSYRTFTMSLMGEIDSDIKWVSSANLGTIEVGYDSTLAIVATSSVTNSAPLFSLTSGKLPNKLVLDKSGIIAGKVTQYGRNNDGVIYFDGGLTTFDNKTTTFDREYTFTVSATDGYSTISRDFTLTVTDPDLTSYTNISVKPHQSLDNRQSFADFINDINVFDQSKIYRLADPAFGIQTELSMLFYAGIERANASTYVDALRTDRITIKYDQLNGSVVIDDEYIGSKSGAYGTIVEVDTFNSIAYIKMSTPERFITDEVLISGTNTISVVTLWAESWRFKYDIGSPKLAIAKHQGSNDIVYEVIYLEVFDKYELDHTSVAQSVTMKNGLKYLPNSTTNMRNNIAALNLKTENAFIPLWMQTPQTTSTPATGFIKAIPLCYCLPGEGQYILSNINHSGFDFSLIDYDIDRYIIEDVLDYDSPLYLKLL